MVTFNSSWRTTRAAGPPSLARTLIGALLFCLALGVIVLGAIFGVLLLAIGLLVSAVGSLFLALRRQLTGNGSSTTTTTTTQDATIQRNHTRQSAELQGMVIDVESVVEKRR